MPVERLDDHFAALLVEKGFQPRNFIGHQRRRNRVGKIQRVELLVGLAQARRIVQHEGAMAVGQAEQHRRVKIGRIGGRVLAHEYRVEGLERILGGVVEKFVVRVLAHHFASPRPRDHMRTARVEVAQAEEIDLVTAELRLEHEHEGRVLVDQHALERIHDEGKFMRLPFPHFLHLRRLTLAHREVTPPLC